MRFHEAIEFPRELTFYQDIGMEKKFAMSQGSTENSNFCKRAFAVTEVYSAGSDTLLYYEGSSSDSNPSGTFSIDGNGVISASMATKDKRMDIRPIDPGVANIDSCLIVH